MRGLMKKIPKGSLAVPLIFVLFISMTLVCASFSTEMYINGDAYVRAEADIRIDDVKMKSASNGAFETYNRPKFLKDSVELYTTLPNLDSELTYEITINNTSDDVYIITDIATELSNESIISNINDYADTVIEAGETLKMEITFKYGVEALPEDITQTASFKFNFEVPTASMIEYSSSYTSKDNLQDALDELFSIYK